MELRKLLRLLEELKEQHGDRVKVCLKTDLALKYDNLTYQSISKINTTDVVWRSERSDRAGTENWKTVITLE